MKIYAKVIAASISPWGVPLYTLELCYPRFIHSEFMTHRVFSRNASSSRAIPVAKMLEQVRNSPAMPVHWGKNQPGMQAREELTGAERQRAESEWRVSAFLAAQSAERMQAAGAHKQITNRLLEPFQWIKVIVTATEWGNFFELRDHEDAQPEIRALAVEIRAAIDGAKPRLLMPGEWHLPYIHDSELDEFCLIDLRKASGARCARVSYLTHDGQATSIEKDVALYERLVGARPIHASPIEHQATPDHRRWFLRALRGEYVHPQLHGNLKGWIQHRKLVEQQIWNS